MTVKNSIKRRVLSWRVEVECFIVLPFIPCSSLSLTFDLPFDPTNLVFTVPAKKIFTPIRQKKKNLHEKPEHVYKIHKMLKDLVDRTSSHK